MRDRTRSAGSVGAQSSPCEVPDGVRFDLVTEEVMPSESEVAARSLRRSVAQLANELLYAIDSGGSTGALEQIVELWWVNNSASCSRWLRSRAPCSPVSRYTNSTTRAVTRTRTARHLVEELSEQEAASALVIVSGAPAPAMRCWKPSPLRPRMTRNRRRTRRRRHVRHLRPISTVRRSRQTNSSVISAWLDRAMVVCGDASCASRSPSA
jgi:hypothetical protein